MNSNQLKRFINKKDVTATIKQLVAALSSPIRIIDTDENGLFEEGQTSSLGQHDILVYGETVGYVIGDSNAAAISSVVGQLAEAESEKKALGRETLDKYKELNMLYDISEKIAVCLETEEVAKTVIREARRLIKSDNVSIMLINDDSGVLEIVAASGEEYSPRETFALDEGIAGFMHMSGKAEIINDVQADERFVQRANSISSMLCAPLRIKDEIIGVFNLSCTEPHSYVADDLKLLTALSFQVAIAIENARLYEDLQKTSKIALDKLKLASLDTIYQLTRAAEYRDKNTGDHIERMSRYAAAIARKLTGDENFSESVLYSAPMHDIGKIGIPDRILLKKDKLTGEEWDTMKQHTEIGGEILENSSTEFGQLGKTVALSHHERWDGSGYPASLSGSDIPLIGRIIALADVFDAITSKRSYNEAFSIKNACKIIEESDGNHFDPDVVNAFFSIINEILEIKKECTRKSYLKQ